MTIGVALLVTFLVFIMLGYRFNRATSTIEQGGLVQFASRPTDANVTIGKARLSDATPSKITVNPGNYDALMERDGYQSWRKNVNVRAGEVLWLNYAQLVPNEIERTTAASFPTLAQAKTSPNSSYIAMLPSASNPSMTILKVESDKTSERSVSIDQKRSGTSYRIEDWSDDSSRILVSATTGATKRWLLVERDAESVTDVIDITKRYGTGFDRIEFDPRGSDRLVVLTESKDLRLLNISNDSLSSILASNVESFSFYENSQIFYISKSDNVRALSYVSFVATDTPREIKRIESDAPAKVAAASYFGDPYIVMTEGRTSEVYRLARLPSSSSDDALSMETLASRELPSVPTYVSIRSSGRFVVMQYANGFATYDIELKKDTLTTVKGIGTEELRWFDRYHVYVTNGSGLKVMEFDGGNQYDVAQTSARFDALQTTDAKFIYSFTPTKDRKSVELQRSRMILE
jgi:hypothetical protein